MVELSAVPSTLRIPLAARAFGDALFPHVAVGDAYAADLLAAMGDDGRQWLKDRASVFGVLARTRVFREQALRFLQAHPAGHVVNLGCGLSHYFQWLDNGRARMTDADLPEVLALRRQWLAPAGDRHRFSTLDLTADDWWDALDLPASPDAEPLFLLWEGVSMYFEPEQVQAVLRSFGERAPAGSVLAFDALCWLAEGRARLHPSVRLTAAEFRWGPRNLAELTRSSDRLALLSVRSVMDGYGFPYAFAGPAFQAVWGVPIYAVYVLGTQDEARA
ncbi:class I SAM-dependent methyltransferase [Xylophilus sp. GOD-11R]|uniref:class I SAM-dependent methyltransferase n=1 Tax=Xylophilus sp. GOD-11R TaxID=3089814 RepID=UPI00298C17F3|nr:class I SAM-dependent methyltransferase [Xylophilus sp. GOD-11R]WPB57487.1 class I SAM-dependent methyltransferase [Xylophilus sp. GOD-11R]